MEFVVFVGVTEPGWESLRARVFQPKRPQLQPVIEKAFALVRADSQRVVDHADDPPEVPNRRLRGDDLLAATERRTRHTALVGAIRERAMAPADAWELLAPKSWLADERRLLVGEQVPRGSPPPPGALRAAWTAWLSTREAPSIDYVLALASAPEGVEAAEAHAREACRRMAPFGIGTVEKVLWWVEHNVRLIDYVGAVPFRARADEALGLGVDEIARGENIADVRDPPPDAWRGEWLRLAKRDLVRRNAWSDRRPGSMENPFEPLVSLWLSGYAPVAVLEDRIVLAATAPSIEELTRPLA